MLHATIIALAVTLAGATAFAQQKPTTDQPETERPISDRPISDKERDIRRFLEITGARQLAAQTLKQTIGVYRKSMPNVPAKFWDELIAQFDASELIDQLVPVYDKHLSQEDLTALIAFYESPAGRSYTRALPKISADSSAVGQRWGEAMAKRVNKKLSEAGHEPR